MRHAMTVRLAAVWFGLWASGLGPLAAQGLSREEALAAVYGNAQVTAERVFLTPEQVQQVAAQAGADPVSPLVARYLATRNGETIGRAYVDTHTVRTKRESLLISLDTHGPRDTGRCHRLSGTHRVHGARGVAGPVRRSRA